MMGSTVPVVEEAPTVAVYREMLLNYNEPFILAHGLASARYQACYVGMQRVNGVELPPERTIVLNHGSRFGSAEEALFKLAGLAPPSFLRRVRRAHPVILHAYTGVSGAQALPLARKLHVPFIVTCTGYEATASEDELHQYRYRGRVYLRRRKALQRDADLFLPVSDFIRRRLVAQGFPEQKTLVHYIGIDTEFFRPDPAVPREPVVLFIGRLIPTKGVEHLLAAMGRIAGKIPGVEVVVIGKGGLRPALEQQAAELGVRVRFLGKQPRHEVRAWMNRASILGTPSVTALDGTVEALPAVCAEAQSMGLPVAGFDSGGISEGVVHGETGVLAAESDDAALAENLRRLLTDRALWRRMSEAGMRRARQRFDLATQARALENLYDAVRDRRNGAGRWTQRGASNADCHPA